MEKQAGGKEVSLVRTRKVGGACGCLSRDGEEAVGCVAGDNGLEMSSRSRREGPVERMQGGTAGDPQRHLQRTSHEGGGRQKPVEGPSWELTCNRGRRRMEACPPFSSEEAGHGNLARADSGCPRGHGL